MNWKTDRLTDGRMDKAECKVAMHATKKNEENRETRETRMRRLSFKWHCGEFSCKEREPSELEMTLRPHEVSLVAKEESRVGRATADSFHSYHEKKRQE